MSKVYIVFDSGHNFNASLGYGEIIYLTNIKLHRFDTDKIYKVFLKKLINSDHEDYILISALNVMNAIACCIMVAVHHKINLLIYNNMTDAYVKKTIDFSPIGY
jgi:hypothetical protein